MQADEGNVLSRLQADVWAAKISTRGRLRLFISKVAAVGLYACQAWNFRAKHVRQLESTYFQLLKRLLRVPKVDWMAISYEKLIEFGKKLKCEVLPFELLLYRHQLAYMGHLARREDDQLQKLILRSRLAEGVPIHHTQRASHLTNYREALRALDIPEQGWEDIAEDRNAWRAQVREDGTDCFMKKWLETRAAEREARHTTEFLKNWRTQLLFDIDGDTLPDEVALGDSTAAGG